MPAPSMTPRVLLWSGAGPDEPDTRIVVGDDGGIASVEVGGEQLLRLITFPGIDGEPYVVRDVRVEADEIETVGTSAGLEVRVRHSFDRTWQWRIGLTNPGAGAVEVDSVPVSFATGRDGLVEGLAAGAVSSLTVHRFGGSSCLGLRLTRGELVDDGGVLGTPPLRLEPGGRYQVTLSGEWYAESLAVEARRPVWFPESLDLAAEDEPDFVIEHPDAAVRAVEVGPPTPSRIVRYEVADGSGRTRLDVAYVAEDATYSGIAEQAAQRGFLTGADEALGVYRAMTGHGIARDEAIELIEDFLADPGSGADPLRAVVLIRSQDWAGGEDRLAQAAELLAGLTLQPGVGLAWLTLWVAQQLRGERPEVEPVLARLRPRSDDRPISGVLAELSLLTGPGRDPDATRRAMRQVELLARGGPATLRNPAFPLEHRAIAVVVRALSGEPGAGAPPEVQAAVRRLIGLSATAPDGLRALAWLTLRPAEA